MLCIPIESAQHSLFYKINSVKFLSKIIAHQQKHYLFAFAVALVLISQFLTMIVSFCLPFWIKFTGITVSKLFKVNPLSSLRVRLKTV